MALSRARRLLGMVAGTIPDMVLCKDFLVVRPMGRVVTGFLVETTSYRDHIQLWRVVQPLYRPMSGNVPLNFSRRIGGPHLIHVPRDDWETAASRVRASITEADVAYVRSIRTPADFLERGEPTAAISKFPVDLDRGVSAFLAGDSHRAHELIAHCASHVAATWNERLKAAYLEPVSHLYRAMIESPKALNALLDGWQAENIERLRLHPALADA